MPVTQGVINASLLKIHTGVGTPVVVADQIEVSIEASHELRDITTKDSGAFEESAEGLRAVNLNFSLMYKLNSDNGIDELITAFLGRTLLDVHVKSGNVDDPDLVCKAHIYSLSISAGVEESVQCDVQLGATGAVTFN